MDTHQCSCGQLFHPRYPKQQYCSMVCARPHHSQSRRNRVALICVICEQSFEVKSYRAATAKYCSRACWNHRRKVYIKSCDICQKSFDAIDHRARFCSSACLLEWKTGETSPVWKGGKSTQKLRGRLGDALTKWRKSVYQRDNYTCQHCGQYQGVIHAHHLQALAEYPELALVVTNGITLCVSCHEVVHRRAFGSPAKYQKQCLDCHARTTGRSQRCRSCSSKYAHQACGHNPQRTCDDCGSVFTGRPKQRYCSKPCGLKARHRRSNSTGVTPVA